MTSMPEVIARLRAALTGLRPEELREIHQHLTENVQPLLTELAAETTNPDLAATPELLAGVLTAIGNAADLYDHATELTHSYIADHETETTPTTSGETPPGTHERPASITAAPPLGLWKGKTATDYADIAGEGIGRKARGSKKSPIREVQTVAEVDELFAALARGGQRIEIPGYDGIMVQLPDGTTVGYRTKAASSPYPTLDIKASMKRFLKVHVNMEEW